MQMHLERLSLYNKSWFEIRNTNSLLFDEIATYMAYGLYNFKVPICLRKGEVTGLNSLDSTTVN